MQPLKIAINGLGRVGRTFIRIAWENPAFEFVGLSSRSPLPSYAHLLKYDSTYGVWEKNVEAREEGLAIDGKVISYFLREAGQPLPWDRTPVDLVVEASGKYRKMQDASEHLQAGAKYVLITAPVDGPGKTLVYGVNESSFDPKTDRVISAASCTSICSALVLEALRESIEIERGMLTTVHAFTSDQNLQDSAHKDLRRARAASQSIIPTNTGVTDTLDQLFPEMSGKFDGLSLRVPIVVPSVLNLVLQTKNRVDAKEINDIFKKASLNKLKDGLAVSDLPLVSVDFIQNPHGAIVDLLSTKVVDHKLLNILAWYDNEWGYVTQVTRLLKHLASKIV